MTTDEMEPAPLSRDEAERLTERIRTALDRVASAWSDLSERVTEAFERRADKALGYDSWAEYAEAELKPSSPLSIEVRREIVGLLSAQGMSTRAIAPAVGVTQKTVVKDAQVIPQVSPADHRDAGVASCNIAPAPGSNPTDAELAEIYGDVSKDEFEQALAGARDKGDLSHENVVAHLPHRPTPVTGLDGKAYPRPEPREVEPSKPRRKPITDAARDAGWELHKAIERIERIFEDDRFNGKNKEQVATRLRGHLLNTSEACQRLARTLEGN